MANLIVLFISTTAILGVTLFLARQFAKRSPIERVHSTAEIVVDWKLAGLRLVLGKLLSPVTNVCTLILVNAGGGFICNLMGGGSCFPS